MVKYLYLELSQQNMTVEFNPENFNPKFESVGCFINCKEEIIALYRHKKIRHGDCWGLPSGMIEKWETPEQAIIREIKEETGLDIDKVDLLNSYKVRYPEFDFIFHLFNTKTNERKKLVLNEKEHHIVRWIKPTELLGKKLMPAFKEFLFEFYNIQ